MPKIVTVRWKLWPPAWFECTKNGNFRGHFLTSHRRKQILGIYHKIKNVPWPHNMAYRWGQIWPLTSLRRFVAKNYFFWSSNILLASNRHSDLRGRIWPHPYPILWGQGTFFILWYTPKICILLWFFQKMAPHETIFSVCKTCWRPQFSSNSHNFWHDEGSIIYLQIILSKVLSQSIFRGSKSIKYEIFKIFNFATK